MVNLKSSHDAVATIMTPNPKAITLNTSLSEVGKIFSKGVIHHLPVVDGQELIGIVSYFDLIRVSFEQSFGVTDKKSVYAVLDNTLDVNAIMTKDPVCILSTGTIREAAEKLCTGSFHALPVVNDDHELVGIITSKDLINFLLKLH
jgi:CBS domain-containing membrane protein